MHDAPALPARSALSRVLGQGFACWRGVCAVWHCQPSVALRPSSVSVVPCDCALNSELSAVSTRVCMMSVRNREHVYKATREAILSSGSISNHCIRLQRVYTASRHSGTTEGFTIIRTKWRNGVGSECVAS